MSVVLIAFDFGEYSSLQNVAQNLVEAEFAKHVRAGIAKWAKKLDKELEARSIQGCCVEVFFLPVESIDELRNKFQTKIGWNS